MPIKSAIPKRSAIHRAQSMLCARFIKHLDDETWTKHAQYRADADSRAAHRKMRNAADPVTSVCKAKLYTTARLTPEALTLTNYAENSGFVSVRFFNVQHNVKFDVMENLYSVYADAAQQNFLGHFFERALSEFCI